MGTFVVGGYTRKFRTRPREVGRPKSFSIFSFSLYLAEGLKLRKVGFIKTQVECIIDSMDAECPSKVVGGFPADFARIRLGHLVSRPNFIAVDLLILNVRSWIVKFGPLRR